MVVVAPPAVARSAEELNMSSGGKRLSQHNSTVCPLRVTNTHFCYCNLNLVLLMFVPFGGKTRGSKRTVSGQTFGCLDLLLGGRRGWM